ncbi:MAG: PmoA family protein [Planctomycetaceae bacterium]|jgi:hypothetical protein|nr:PmoA family protein [Planctomycetaceae bacterium]MBT6485601.1 PmoA family protein [Planctomycetaceae bacterium]MBT6493134.1 PmoA family protein [Planctomycetaceae bacterium]
MTRILAVAVFTLLVGLPDMTFVGNPIRFAQKDGRLFLSQFGRPVFEYVTSDDKVRRPYFHGLHTPSGVRVTRVHPPVKGSELADHPTMHPGLWMAFGDISGADFWRNKGLVRHVKFLKTPTVENAVASFTVRNSYEADGKPICTEDCEIQVTFNSFRQCKGTLITWTSRFTPAGGSFYFGDQEEMGLGVRVATPFTVVKGGTIRDSEGRKNGKEIWGKQADWCEYTGVLNGKRVGIVLMPGVKNFRRSWFHARDYGLLLANPFGRNAFTKGEKSKIEVKAGWELRLRYGVFLYDSESDNAPNIGAVYREFTKQLNPRNK